ncbi:MAG: phenylalanine--tRNA ligase beta subunit-related protein [Anaerolineaceae bacterium]
MQIHVSPLVSQQYPGACFGFLAIENAAAPTASPEFEAAKIALQTALQKAYPDEEAIKSDAVIQAYIAYYKRFKKSYHVALQLESVALKGKPIPSVSPLVECMFMSELANRLLTAVHDISRMQGNVFVDIAGGGEAYTTMRGAEQELKAADLYMRDDAGIISSIIYGPDARTQVTANTDRVLFTVYVPPGIGSARVKDHLTWIRACMQLICPKGHVSMDWVG